MSHRLRPVSAQTTLLAPFAGTIVSLPHAPRQTVSAGTAVVVKRHDQGRRTARENLADLLDADSFVAYGPMMFAAQERRRSKEELIERTPADGLAGSPPATASPAMPPYSAAATW